MACCAYPTLLPALRFLVVPDCAQSGNRARLPPWRRAAVPKHRRANVPSRNPDQSGPSTSPRCPRSSPPPCPPPQAGEGREEAQLTGESETRKNDLPERSQTSVQSKGGNDDTPAQAVPAQYCSVVHPRLDGACPQPAGWASAGGSEQPRAANTRRNAAHRPELCSGDRRDGAPAQALELPDSAPPLSGLA